MVEDGKPGETVPQSVGEQVYLATVRTLDYRAPDGAGEMVPIVDQPADRDSWELGARQAIDKCLSMYPSEDPTSFAIGQMWLYLRAMGEQQMNVMTVAIAEIRADTRKLVAKLDEYSDALPDPDSLVGRLGRWGGSKRNRGGNAGGAQQIGPAGG